MKVKEKSAYSISEPLCLKLLTWTRLSFSYHNEDKYMHKCGDSVNPVCSNGAGIKTTNHCLLRCENFALVWSSFLKRIFEINVEFRKANDVTMTSLMLFGSEKQTFDVNTKISNVTTQFLKDSGGFDEPLIWS